MSSKTFRLFVSSTFSDFKKEREVLQAEVFPELKEYCSKHYTTFQPIDLRWGVSNEAQLDQKTLELCLSEVHTCNAHPRPNFLIMAGDRYGWIPLPYAIEKEEYETLTSHLKDTSLLSSWYELDTNHIPHSYITKQRSGEFVDYDTWVKVENQLRALLQKGAIHLPEDKRAKYFTSATQAEFEAGAMPHEDTFALLRHIPKESLQKGTFYEDEEDYNKALEFSHTIASTLPKENALHVSPNQLNQEKLDQAYLKEFKKKLLSFLKTRIDEFLSSLSTEKLSPLEKEKLANEKYLKEKLKGFIYTEKLKKIKEEIKGYVNSTELSSPYILFGPSGSGKSAIMAQVIEELKEQKAVKLLYRFIGANPNESIVGSLGASNSTRAIWISLLDESKIELGELGWKLRNYDSMLDTKKTPWCFEEFSKQLHEAILNIQEPVCFIIDAIDQIGHEDKLDWLPVSLPGHIKIIITALEDTNYKQDSSYLEHIRAKGLSVNQIPAFSNPTSLLHAILKEYNRSVTVTQEEYFLAQYQSANTPLYITIAAQEMRHWKSHQTEYKLEKTNRGIIQEFIQNLSSLYYHDKEFVKRTLSYLIASKGLSESELLILLATDEAFINKMAPEQFHKNSTKELPLVHWSRLQSQLSPFFKFSDDEGQEILGFFHREFQDSIQSFDGFEKEFEKIIEDIFKLIKKRQKDEFGENRWGKLYIQAVHDYHFLSKNMDLLQSQAGSIAKINNEVWLERFLKYIQSIPLYNDANQNFEKAKSYFDVTICGEIALVVTKSLYENNPERWVEKHIASINNLGLSYYRLNNVDKAIQLTREALEITKSLFQRNPEKWEEFYSTNLNNFILFCKHSPSFSKFLREGINFQEETLETRKVLYNSDPERWAKQYIESLNVLALDYQDSANSFYNSNKGIELLEESLMITKALYKANTKKWAELYTKVLHIMALSYYGNSKYLLKKSIELAEEALKITKTHYDSSSEKGGNQYLLIRKTLDIFYESSKKSDIFKKPIIQFVSKTKPRFILLALFLICIGIYFFVL